MRPETHARPLAPEATRLFAVDLLKAIGCVLIVWHHLAFYGPMSDIAYPLAPGLIAWLYDYGRMAVQLFLVAGGFLAAAQLAPQGAAAPQQPLRLILRRYLRLVLPLAAALALAVAAAAAVRPWLDHDSVPAAPSLGQLLAHALLLQDLLGMEALSAGVWYVAIDLQLYAMAVLLLVLGAAWRGALLVLLLTALSLFWWNRLPALDVSGLYFFGAYGLGMLAYWIAHSRRPLQGALALAVLGGAALALDFRARIALALATALLLVWAATRATDPGRAAAAAWRRGVSALARISYSVFLVHFPVGLLVNALVARAWPSQPLANALGMLAAFVLSLAAGWALYQGLERRRATLRAVLAAQAGLLLGGMAALLLAADA
ncbi:acyltransferase family protein [Ramlibacter sp. 2FC]|uniref:acyltransferase family protein n=1 Tax=Ramlibacter sp. 2FC TaxID=2502188 RepID=UPI00201D7061|nr:acyltransferase family protein [Ramlibacter sp. 2FC]